MQALLHVDRKASVKTWAAIPSCWRGSAQILILAGVLPVGAWAQTA
jgi:hypothetical protein